MYFWPPIPAPHEESVLEKPVASVHTLGAATGTKVPLMVANAGVATTVIMSVPTRARLTDATPSTDKGPRPCAAPMSPRLLTRPIPTSHHMSCALAPRQMGQSRRLRMSGVG